MARADFALSSAERGLRALASIRILPSYRQDSQDMDAIPKVASGIDLGSVAQWLFLEFGFT